MVSCQRHTGINKSTSDYARMNRTDKQIGWSHAPVRDRKICRVGLIDMVHQAKWLQTPVSERAQWRHSIPRICADVKCNMTLMWDVIKALSCKRKAFFLFNRLSPADHTIKYKFVNENSVISIQIWLKMYWFLFRWNDWYPCSQLHCYLV